MMSTSVHDVVICGGGLAGLTLARQLRRALPTASIAVIEPSERPLPEACHKVGESSVELGSHYLQHVLDLEAYLQREHLPKNGLRFFVGDPNAPLDERTEIGPSAFPPVPSFQLDRGRLENDLRAGLEREITLLEGCTASRIELESGTRPHAVHVEGRIAQILRTRWVVDATGRRRLLQRQLGLGRASPIRASAAWFRVTGRIDIADWVPSERASWHRRDREHRRWLSTVHLCGPGYWIWLIPLASGYTSVGIVADSSHEFSRFNTLARALQWIDAHQPVLARALSEAKIADFRCIRHYAYGSERVLSEQRWSCVGEAGLFVDPLYSPGTDLIALANSFTTEVVKDDLEGRLDPRRIEQFNRLYLGWAEDTTTMLRDHGLTLAKPSVFSTKVWWDFYYYWSFICPYFFQGIYRLPSEQHRRYRDLGERFFALNEQAQRLLRAWARSPDVSATSQAWIPLPLFPSVLADRHLELQHQRSPEETFAFMEQALQQATQAVGEILMRALCFVEPAAIPQFAELAGLEHTSPPVDADRVELEALRGGVRRRQLPRLVRDMERALGRGPRGAIDLQALLQNAGL